MIDSAQAPGHTAMPADHRRVPWPGRSSTKTITSQHNRPGDATTRPPATNTRPHEKPRLDGVYQKRYEFTFPIFDIPREQFVLAGDAWKLCQAKEQDPNDFDVGSIEGVRGLWFIRNDLVRDLAALNKVEVLPWDEWGLADQEFEEMTQEDLQLMNQAAVLTIDDSKFSEMRTLYETNEALKVPKVVKSHTTYSGCRW